MLRFEGVTVGDVLRNVSLEVETRSVVAVFGARTRGKQSLLRVAAGIERPDCGSVRCEGRAVLVHDSWPSMGGKSVVDQLALPLVAGGASISRSRSRAVAYLVEQGLDGWLGCDLAELEEGDRRRLGVMRALIAAPDLVLVDNPTGVGSLLQQDAIAGLLQQAKRETAVLLTTNEMRGLASADRILSLVAGQLSEALTAGNVIEFPAKRSVG